MMKRISRSSILNIHPNDLPVLLVTMGDVAGIGPEIIAKAWPELQAHCQPVVVGDAPALRRTLAKLRLPTQAVDVAHVQQGKPASDTIPIVQGTDQRLDAVSAGQIHAAAGQAAYDFLCTAIRLTQAGQAAGIVTGPLHKEGLRAAGLRYPGHTEILAEKAGVKDYGMM